MSEEEIDRYKAEAAPEIGFECGKCKEWNSGHTDELDNNGEEVGGCAVESDRIDCNQCRAENLVYRKF